MAKIAGTNQKVNDILNSDYNANGKYNLLCAMSEKMENAGRYIEQEIVDNAISALKR